MGLYYLTMDREHKKGEGKVFAGLREVLAALRMGLISLHAKCVLRSYHTCLSIGTIAFMCPVSSTPTVYETTHKASPYR